MPATPRPLPYLFSLFICCKRVSMQRTASNMLAINLFCLEHCYFFPHIHFDTGLPFDVGFMGLNVKQYTCTANQTCLPCHFGQSGEMRVKNMAVLNFSLNSLPKGSSDTSFTTDVCFLSLRGSYQNSINAKHKHNS